MERTSQHGKVKNGFALWCCSLESDEKNELRYIIVKRFVNWLITHPGRVSILALAVLQGVSYS